MKTAITPFALSTLLLPTLLLTACGGTTHGNTVNPTPTLNQQNTDQQTKSALTSPAPAPNVSLPSLIVGHTQADGTDKVRIINGNTDINSISIDGKVFALTATDSENIRHANYNLNTKAGWLSDDITKKSHLFYQGNLTATSDLPKGIVHYEGVGLIIKDGVAKKTGDITLTANFTTKNLTGQIHSAEIRIPPEQIDLNAKAKDYLNIQATIKDNTFIGTHEGTSVQGAFFGDHAKEAVGIWQNNTYGNGVFGTIQKTNTAQ
ncbi:transferrin-binding protein-like solute binding protein [Moraxella nasovis]|uniref:transferrin-binding protein-like solute binding protein n=1 Tax=Moraxella nasovis TaxID=2904121 RepID=UPI001F6257B9|nr:transferrin-binding protein-like solute binding protein [Moraxella nasovis]UNU72766.1 transferrin-binding protein-like solute binding protein [Moraxella nasovis]